MNTSDRYQITINSDDKLITDDWCEILEAVESLLHSSKVISVKRFVNNRYVCTFYLTQTP